MTELFPNFLSKKINKYKPIAFLGRGCLFWLFVTISCQSNAAWLSVCSDLPLSIIEDHEEGYFAHVIDANEKAIVIKITALQPVNSGCETKALPVNADKVSWAGFDKPVTTKVKQIALQGRELNNHFSVSEMIISEESVVNPLASLDPSPSNYKSLSTNKIHNNLPLRASWFWSPDIWLKHTTQIFDRQSAFGLNRIYVTLPVSQGKVQYEEQLRLFLQTAHQHGLQVWAVLGDPRAILEDEQQKFLSLAGAYQVYNSNNLQQKIDGLQLDIEPYLLPGYQLNPTIWLQKQAKTVKAVHQTAPSLALDMVVPFWFEPLQGAGAEMLTEVEASITSITVMNYRTDPNQIQAFAEKFLAWGELRQKQVYIALESLTMIEEELRTYTQADRGELWRFDFKVAQILVLLQQTEILPGGQAYRFSHSRKVDGSETSFFKQPGELIKLLAILEAQFGAWSSFAGLVLHGQEK